MELEVRWTGTDANGKPWPNTWEPMESMYRDVPKLVDEYFKKKKLDLTFKTISKPLLDEIFEVQGFTNHRCMKGYVGKVELLVKWTGTDAKGKPWEDTWEPLENMFRDVPNLVKAYFKEKKLQLKFFMMQSGDPQEDHVMEYSDDEVISDAEAPIGPESSQER